MKSQVIALIVSSSLAHAALEVKEQPGPSQTAVSGQVASNSRIECMYALQQVLVNRRERGVEKEVTPELLNRFTNICRRSSPLATLIDKLGHAGLVHPGQIVGKAAAAEDIRGELKKALPSLKAALLDSVVKDLATIQPEPKIKAADAMSGNGDSSR